VPKGLIANDLLGMPNFALGRRGVATLTITSSSSSCHSPALEVESFPGEFSGLVSVGASDMIFSSLILLSLLNRKVLLVPARNGSVFVAGLRALLFGGCFNALRLMMCLSLAGEPGALRRGDEGPDGGQG
jgi:hypothetical protein